MNKLLEDRELFSFQTKKARVVTFFKPVSLVIGVYYDPFGKMAFVCPLPFIQIWLNFDPSDFPK